MFILFPEYKSVGNGEFRKLLDVLRDHIVPTAEIGLGLGCRVDRQHAPRRYSSENVFIASRRLDNIEDIFENPIRQIHRFLDLILQFYHLFNRHHRLDGIEILALAAAL